MYIKKSILTLIEPISKTMARYKCECGNEIVASIYQVENLNKKSCGCLLSKVLKERNTKHNLSGHPLERVWQNMKNRCYRSNDKAYARYGGRGVRVCDEWINDFKAFYEWAMANGWKTGLQLDKDKKGDGLLYSPETCCFLTQIDNCNNTRTNKRIEYDGVVKTISEWAREYNIPPVILTGRIRMGWNIDRALSEPIEKKGANRRVDYLGKTYTRPQFAKIIGMQLRNVEERLRRGWSPERIAKTPISHKPKGDVEIKYAFGFIN